MANMKSTKITLEDFKHLPWWIWIFIIACVILPITTIGGAVPVVVALLGIILCVRVSALSTLKTTEKLLYCCGVVILVWGIAYLFIFSISNLN